MLAAIIWATVGSLVGAWLLYGVGRAWGAERLGAFVERVPLMHRSDVDRATARFEKHGPTTVFIGRLIPGIRSFVSIPAGVTRMNPFVFTAYTLAGSALFNTALIVVGYELGAQYHRVQPYIDTVSLVVGVLLLASVAAFIVRRGARRARTSR